MLVHCVRHNTYFDTDKGEIKRQITSVPDYGAGQCALYTVTTKKLEEKLKEIGDVVTIQQCPVKRLA